MCGIIGVISNKNVVPTIVDGLKKLEYRGYDSAGLAVTDKSVISNVKTAGKISVLESAVSKAELNGTIGIGHTRWATHGKPTEDNAHPHISYNNDVAVVHNGIIENYQEIREKLRTEGYKLKSETDTETIPNLISLYLNKGLDIKNAMISVAKELEGTFGIAVILKGGTDKIIVARRGSPLIIGYGDNEMYVSSGFCAISALTQKITNLEDNDIAILTRDSIEIFDTDGKTINRPIQTIEGDDAKVCKAGYPHYMLKEIFEQPQVIRRTLTEYVDESSYEINLPKFPFNLKDIERVTIVACGTSYYAGCVAKYLIESIAKINVNVDIASEFRYRQTPLSKGGIAIFISQSGETADTLAALRYCKEHDQKILSIVNVANSNMAFESDAILKTVAGPEIGVASTKAFVAQVTILSLFTIKLAVERGAISREGGDKLLKSMYDLPEYVNNILSENNTNHIESIAKDFVEKDFIIYMGRGISYTIAQEGALKFKELTYIPVEAIAAGELKHGPIALIDKNVPIITIAPSDELFEKIASNVQEVSARDGQVILISDKKGIDKIGGGNIKAIQIPDVQNKIQSAIVTTIPVQLLAYYTAVLKGTDVDQPRNLAKSVTVE